MSLTSPQGSTPQMSTTTPAATSMTTTDPSIGGVQGYAHRMAFLTEIDSQTWIARYTAADRLGEPIAVSSPAAYAAWLRRTAAAWSQLSLPTPTQTQIMWPFKALSFVALDAAGQLEADLRELAVAGGGTGRVPAPRSGGEVLQLNQEELDVAYLAGSTYLMIAAAQEVAVLAADVEHLSRTTARTPVPQHFVRHCAYVSAQRGAMRRELADWAEAAGPEAGERVILTARMLAEQLASALKALRPGW